MTTAPTKNNSKSRKWSGAPCQRLANAFDHQQGSKSSHHPTGRSRRASCRNGCQDFGTSPKMRWPWIESGSARCGSIDVFASPWTARYARQECRAAWRVVSQRSRRKFLLCVQGARSLLLLSLFHLLCKRAGLIRDLDGFGRAHRKILEGCIGNRAPFPILGKIGDEFPLCSDERAQLRTGGDRIELLFTALGELIELFDDALALFR